jgi:hypothetical protein
MDLHGLIKDCISFQLSSAQIDELEEGFPKWVTNYERCNFFFPYISELNS